MKIPHETERYVSRRTLKYIGVCCRCYHCWPISAGCPVTSVILYREFNTALLANRSSTILPTCSYDFNTFFSTPILARYCFYSSNFLQDGTSLGLFVSPTQLHKAHISSSICLLYFSPCFVFFLQNPNVYQQMC